jgi:hypothetical protein
MARPQVVDKLLETDICNFAYWAHDLNQLGLVVLSHRSIHRYRGVGKRKTFEMDTVLSCDDLVWLMVAQVCQELVTRYVFSTPPTWTFAFLPQSNADDCASFTR